MSSLRFFLNAYVANVCWISDVAVRKRQGIVKERLYNAGFD